jgi:hypothetical protein
MVFHTSDLYGIREVGSQKNRFRKGLTLNQAGDINDDLATQLARLRPDIEVDADGGEYRYL